MYVFLFKLLILAIGIWAGWDLHIWYYKRIIKKDSACIAMWNALLKRLINLERGVEQPSKLEGEVSVIIRKESDIEITEDLIESICLVLPEIKLYVLGKIKLCDLLVYAVSREVFQDEYLSESIRFIEKILSNETAIKMILELIPDEDKKEKKNAQIHKKINE